MKQRITIISLILSGILIFDSMQIGQALAMFIIAGQIPGTPYYLSADAMLGLFMLIIGFAAGRLTLRVMSFFGEEKFRRSRA